MPIDYPEPWEADVVYNTSQSEYDPERHYQKRYVKTVDRLPPIDTDNYWELRTVAFNIFMDEMANTNHPTVTPLHEQAFIEYCIGDPNRSRTLDIAISRDPRVVTPSVVELLQRELTEKWPLWRIRLHCERDQPVPESDILIYPDKVFVGRMPTTTPIREAVSHWARDFYREYRTWHAKEYRRHAWFEQRVNECLPKLHENNQCVLSVFQNEEKRQQEVWTLIRGDKYTYVPRNANPSGCDVLGSSVYPIDPSGTVGCEGEPWEHGIGILQVIVYSLDVQELVFRKNPRMTEIAAGEHDEWPLPYCESDIVTDAFLEKWDVSQRSESI